MALPGARRTGTQTAGLLRDLTPAQREAVLADDPVLCLVAGAGAGKTGVLTARVARRCADGTATPSRSLVCTFSRKAADELRHRLFRLGAGGVRAGTIHGLALRILAESRDLDHRPTPVVLGDRRQLLARVVGDDARALATIDTEIGWAKARRLGPDAYGEAAAERRRALRLPVGAVASAYAAYEGERGRRGLLDLDDLLPEAVDALERDPAFAEALRWRSRHVYVDEMQDMNAAQFALVRALCGAEPDLFVVGDPDQAVYGWNGADAALLARVPEVFRGARILRLDVNHRSSPAIVRCAEAVLGAPGRRQSARPEGPLPVLRGHESDADEARWVARQIWLARGPRRRWSHVAVLARTNAQLSVVAATLRAQRIPCAVAGAALAPASDVGGTDADGALLPTDGEAGEPERDEDAVVLTTFHRAKGLQWPCVFVIGLSERFVPLPSARSSAALAEERRLLYVALTRAEDELFCSWAAAGDGGRAPGERCRWLHLLQEERDALERAATADEASVAGHVARLRALVSGGDEPLSPGARARR